MAKCRFYVRMVSVILYLGNGVRAPTLLRQPRNSGCSRVGGMLEFYLDDQFIECYTMNVPQARHIRIGVLGSARRSVRSLQVWQMSLPAS